MSPEGTSVPILLYNLILIILYAQSARKVSQTGNLYFDVRAGWIEVLGYSLGLGHPKGIWMDQELQKVISFGFCQDPTD